MYISTKIKQPIDCDFFHDFIAGFAENKLNFGLLIQIIKKNIIENEGDKSLINFAHWKFMEGFTKEH